MPVRKMPGPDVVLDRSTIPVRHPEAIPDLTSEDEIERLACQIDASEDAKFFGERHAKNRVVARQRLQARAQAAFDAVPENWAPRMARHGLQHLASVWPGVGGDPSWCVAPNTGFEIAPDGVWIHREGHERQYVMSPVVDLGLGRFAALIREDWVTLTVPPPISRDRGHVRTILTRLSEAGVTFGGSIQDGTVDTPGEEAASAYAWWFLTGSFKDTHYGPVVRRFDEAVDDRHREQADVASMPVEAKARLAGVLGRTPADARLS